MDTRNFDTCLSQQKWKTTINVKLHNESGNFKTPEDLKMQFENCKPRCMMKTSRRFLCKNRSHMKEFDVKFTFWMYLTVRVMIGVIGGTAFAMFEGNFQCYHLIFLILVPHR